MPTVAELQIAVSADTSAAERGLTSLNERVSGVGGALQTAFGVAAVAGVAGLAAGLTGAISSAEGFEKQISAITAVAGASTGEIDALRGLVLQLGADTSFSASEAGVGVEALVKAGVSIQDVMGGGARAALDLAAAGAVSVGDAAEIASNAMNVFGLKGADMAHVADEIAGAANASAIDVNDYKFSLAASGAVAATVGVNFEDLSTAIAVMGQAGIKGSDAGTSLKTMMLALTPSTKSATQEMQALGIITADGANQFFDATGKAKSLAEIAGVLQTATAGLTEQQKLQALQTIFGTDAIRAAAVFAKEGAEGFDEMAASIGKVSAQDVANARLDNLAGSMEKLKGSLETAAIMVGEKFLPVLKDLADGATDLVNNAMPSLETGAGAVAGGFEAAIPSIQAFGGFLAEHKDIIAGVVVALGTFVILTTVVEWVTGAIVAIQALTAAMAALATVEAIADALNPITLIIGAIAVAAGLLVVAWVNDWGGIQEKTAAVVGFLSGIPDAIGGFFGQIGEAGQGLAMAVSDAWNVLTAATSAAWESVTSAVASAWASITDAVGTAVAPIVDTVTAAWTTVSDVTSTIFAAITNSMIAVWELIYSNVIQPKLDAITGAVSTAWGTVQSTTETIFNAVVGFLQDTIWAPLSTFISTTLTTIGGAIRTGWTGIQTITETIFNGVLTFVRDTIWAPIGTLVSTTVSLAQTAVETSWKGIQTAGHTFLDPVLTFVRDTIFTPIGTIVGTVMTGVSTAFTTSVNAVSTIVNGTLQTIRTTWETVWGAIKTAAESPQAAMNEIIALIDKLKSIMPEWLIPHSPTPFQIGLEGIAGAAKGMDDAFGSMGNGLAGIQKIAALATSIGGADFGRAAAAISAQETGGGRYLVQQGGTGAVGPFQFDPGGELRNFARDLHVSVAEAARVAITEPTKAAAWALHGYLGVALRAGISQGLSGADLAVYAGRVGQRPKEGTEGAYGEWYRRLFPGYAAGGIAWTPQLAAVAEREPEAIIPKSWFGQDGRGGRSGSQDTLEIVVRTSDREAERIYITGRDIALRRGRVPLGSS